MEARGAGPATQEEDLAEQEERGCYLHDFCVSGRVRMAHRDDVDTLVRPIWDGREG